MSEQDSSQTAGRVTIENVNHPGRISTADAGMYHALRDALLQVLPADAPRAEASPDAGRRRASPAG